MMRLLASYTVTNSDGTETLTLDSIRNWDWEDDPSFTGQVPKIHAFEQQAWQELSRKQGITEAENQILQALQHKIDYRNKKDPRLL